jgi:diguanylate cyclase (GGDEF)-like protein/PAS domain S-box-containing protein
MRATDGTRRTRDVSAWRAGLTVLGTLAVITAEFLLLHGVYDRAQPVQAQSVLVAELRGELAMAGDVDARAVSAGVRRTADALQDVGASEEDVAALRAATAGPAVLDTVRTETALLAQDLADRKDRLDLEAALAYASMLVVASVGWMVWFRRLVSRHRRMQAEVTEQQARAASEGRLAALVRTSADVIVVLAADGTVQYVTASATRVLGVSPADLQGRRLDDGLVTPDSELLIALLTSARDGDQDVRFRVSRPDGTEGHVEGVLVDLLDDPSVNGLVLTVRDVSSRIGLEEQLTHQALHDSLTGLSNRRLFVDRVEHALLRRTSGNRSLTLLFCDLDEFKHVNDRFGHEVGDHLLVEFGRRLAAVAREGDTLARVGGDEFALLLEGATTAEALAVAARLQEQLATPVVVDGHTLDLTVSIGIAEAPPEGITSAELLRNADVAVYTAKEGGLHSTAVYEAQLHSVALERLQLRSDLQGALSDGGLVLYYQPTIDLADPRVTGFEALVRWQHPTRGMVSPVDFVPMAEQYGLIVPLGTWVLQEACRAAVALQRTERGPVSMSVNVSVQQLAEPDFVGVVLNALTSAGLSSRVLVLELTETAMLADRAAVAPVLTQLRAAGIRIAIDDFGTGYSSLSYLRDLPVDVLKVDKSFVDRVATDDQSASLAEAIIAMSHSLGLRTVAEGVEDEDQAAWLTAAGCEYGQGYLWSRPVPLDQAHRLLDGGLRIPGQVGAAVPVAQSTTA